MAERGSAETPVDSTGRPAEHSQSHFTPSTTANQQNGEYRGTPIVVSLINILTVQEKNISKILLKHS